MEVSYGRSREALIVTSIGRVDESTWAEFGAHLVKGVQQAASDGIETLIIGLSSELPAS